MYQYKASVIRVIDGDTLHLTIDFGFDTRHDDTFRLAGIDAPEMSTPEGIAAKQWLVDRLSTVTLLIVTTQKDRREKYGRYLATLWDGFGQDTSINEQMVAEGHATSYAV